MSSSFTITQPFLGAPLQFQPALGSKELEALIDNFVTGSADKQTKFAQVTTDFFLNATVDINTGALVRVYNVWMPVDNFTFESFQQSPTTSQTSGFSPTVYTPTSSTGSFTTTPKSSMSSSHRVTKKTKETKKTAEIRLPGFQIMTRDGVDVTSSAGRGTKTREQREHAHLMRIMKACSDCKRKKVRCDPSHRRSSTEMSRSSTSTGSQNPSPTSSVPSLTTEASLPSFSPSNPIDDFVLYPEGSSPLSFDNTDLSQFNFDLSSALNDTSATSNFQDYSHFDNHQFFDASFDSQFGGQFNDQLYNGHLNNQLSTTPAMSDGYGLDVWDDSLGQSSSSDSWFANTNEAVVERPRHLTESPVNLALERPRESSNVAHTRPHPSAQNGGGSMNSPMTSSTGFDWSMLESDIMATPSSNVDGARTQSSSQNGGVNDSSSQPVFSPALYSQLQVEPSAVLSPSAQSQSLLETSQSDIRHRHKRQTTQSLAVNHHTATSSQTQQLVLQTSGDSGILVDPSDPSDAVRQLASVHNVNASGALSGIRQSPAGLEQSQDSHAITRQLSSAQQSSALTSRLCATINNVEAQYIGTATIENVSTSSDTVAANANANATASAVSSIVIATVLSLAAYAMITAHVDIDIAGQLSQWVENSHPLLVLARLLLVATIVAQLPYFLDVALRSWGLLTLVASSVMRFLSGSSEKSFSSLTSTKTKPTYLSSSKSSSLSRTLQDIDIPSGGSILHAFLNLMTEVV